jgi:ABC-type arginine/histidine transport system permease subunit
MLDLAIFLIGFFVFAAIGTLLAHRVNLFKSSAASFAGMLVAIYLVLHSGTPAQIGH